MDGTHDLTCANKMCVIHHEKRNHTQPELNLVMQMMTVPPLATDAPASGKDSTNVHVSFCSPVVACANNLFVQHTNDFL